MFGTLRCKRYETCKQKYKCIKFPSKLQHSAYTAGSLVPVPGVWWPLRPPLWCGRTPSASSCTNGS